MYTNSIFLIVTGLESLIVLENLNFHMRRRHIFIYFFRRILATRFCALGQNFMSIAKVVPDL